MNSNTPKISVQTPIFPESITEGTLLSWLKKSGEQVNLDEHIADIETDKIVLEVNASANGILTTIKKEGATVTSGEEIAQIDPSGSSKALITPSSVATSKDETIISKSIKTIDTTIDTLKSKVINPAAKNIASALNIDVNKVEGTGRGGRVTKEDVQNFNKQPQDSLSIPSALQPGENSTRREPMSRLRRSVASRLLESKNNTAMLTTFNEVNMKPVMSLRKKYAEVFEKRHNGTRLGFMSFFVRAVTLSLQKYPVINAFIDENEIVYHNYCDIGVAVSSPRGLVVPILRNSENMSLADVEAQIKVYAEKARDAKLTLDELQNGTFTISNGGVFGSLMSTPILNPPQSAILGMHKIQERPMAVDGKVEILPMMYLALSYDHRLIDGKEAVQFLVSIKDFIEDPARMLLDI